MPKLTLIVISWLANLLSLLRALGNDFKHLKCLRLDDMCHLPDGPGAQNFYKTGGITRSVLLKETLRLLPEKILFNGKDLHLSFSEIDEQVIQFNSCAAWRMLNFIFTGVVPPHLRRNSLL